MTFKTLTPPRCLTLLMLLTAMIFNTAAAQTAGLNSAQPNWKDTLLQREYQLLSGFDTYSIKPLRVYAWYMKNNMFGLIDAEGREVCKALYDNFPDLSNEYGNNHGYPSNPFLRVVRNGKYGLIDFDGREILPPVYSYIRPYIKEERMEQNKQQNYFVMKLTFQWYEVDSLNFSFKVDAKGRIFDRSSPEIEEINEDPDIAMYSDGTAGRHDYPGMPDAPSYPVSISRSIPPRTNAYNLQEKKFESRLVFNKTSRKYGLVNRSSGDTLIPMIYDRLELDPYGRIIAGKNFYSEKDAISGKSIFKETLMAMYNIDGKPLFKLQYKEISYFNGLYLFNKDGKIAIYDSLLNAVSKHIYDGVLGSGNAKIMSLAIKGKYALFNMKGKAITGFEYDRIAIPDAHDLPFPMIIAGKNGKEAIMDYTGKLLTGFEYEHIIAECHVRHDGGIRVANSYHSNRPNAWFFVKQNNLWGIMDTSYRLILPCVYEDISKTYNKTIVFLKQNAKWGIRNISSGQSIYPTELDTKPDYKKGYLVLFKNKQYGVIKNDGTPVHDFSLSSNPGINKIYPGLLELTTHVNWKYEIITYIDDYGNVVSLER